MGGADSCSASMALGVELCARPSFNYTVCNLKSVFPILIIIPVLEISNNIQVYVDYYISASTTYFFKMSVSSEDVTHVQLFNDMMFGEFHLSFISMLS